MGAHTLNALDDAVRRTRSRTNEFTIVIGFAARKAIEIAPKRNKQAIRSLLLKHLYQHSSAQCRDLFKRDRVGAQHQRERRETGNPPGLELVVRRITAIADQKELRNLEQGPAREWRSLGQ